MPHVTVRPLPAEAEPTARTLRVMPDQEHLVAAAAESLAAAELFAGAQVLGVYAGEELVGMMLVQPITSSEGRTLLMWDFFIDRNHQRRGLGKGAVMALLRFAATADVATVTLAYDPANTIARDLYRTLGFVETGRINDDGEHEMRIEISAG